VILGAVTSAASSKLIHGGVRYLQQWRVHYNTIRPHSALGYRPPAPEIIVPRKELPMNHEAA
jgi:glycerol-3-phosphate dehydrogenase